jgi:general secretion pathway protein K
MTTGKEKGGALLTVLWVSAALAAISFSVATSVRSETDRVSTAADGLRAWYLASGSVERAMQWMLWGSDYQPKFWQPNKPRLYFSYQTGDVVVEMIPESAKLNINTASMDDLMRVVAAVSGNPMQAQDIASAVLDWRSGGGGASDQYYASIGPSVGAPTFHAPHASFQEIEELLLVRGMTPGLYYGNYVSDNQGRLYASGGLRDCLSVWGSAGPFDVNTMSPALMQAVGVPSQGATAIAARRQDAPFRNMGEVGELGYTTARMVVGGGHIIWTIRATARLRRPDGTPSEVVRTAAATVKLLDPRVYPMMPLRVLRWYDDAWSQNAVAPPGIPAGVPQQ